MKTINTLFLPLLLLSTFLTAADKTYSFIGIQAGAAISEHPTVPTIGVRYGQQTKDYRTSIAYDYGKDSKNKYQTVIIQMDTGILKNQFKGTDFKPYVGASLGFIEHTDGSTGIVDKGYLYGLNTGISYIFNDSLDFDLGYRYLKTGKVVNIDHISDVSLSMHYFY